MTAKALKRRQENEFASFQILSRLFGRFQFVKWRRLLLEFDSLGLCPGSKRERKIRRGMLPSSIKRRIPEVSRRTRAVDVTGMY